MENQSVKHVSGFAPIGMSIMAMTILFVSVALHRVQRGADEGAAAHIFQILMAVQVPIILFFAWKWGRRSVKQALPVLCLQMSLWAAAAASAYFLT